MLSLCRLMIKTRTYGLQVELVPTHTKLPLSSIVQRETIWDNSLTILLRFVRNNALQILRANLGVVCVQQR